MTTYNAAAVSDSVIAYKKAITLQIGRQLRDNMLAMFEGAAGAPRLQLAAMDSWYTTPGAVGTYVFATYSVGDKAFGGTVAGSSLKPSGAAQAVFDGTGSAALNEGSALSGTWQAMGTHDLSDQPTSIKINGATLWQRIA